MRRAEYSETDVFIQQRYIHLTLPSWRHRNVQCPSYLNLMLFSPPPPKALRWLNTKQINLRTCVPSPLGVRGGRQTINTQDTDKVLPVHNLLSESGLLPSFQGVILNFEKQQINPYFTDPEQRTYAFWTAVKARQKNAWISTCLIFSE